MFPRGRHFLPQLRREFARRARDVAGAEEHDQVAGLQGSADGTAQIVQRADEFRRLSLRAHRLGQQRPVDAGNLRLARRIDLRQPQFIRAGKACREILEQMLRAAVTVGLEHHEQSAGPQALQGFQGRADLRWMMAVIVEEPEASI